ncbi:hypothetical protein BDZ97DRAFT_1919112 [Flammula alnicola]|nr:hypothetical protein BDZ97DRAFT_1919112 [Flammula alnicola]
MSRKSQSQKKRHTKPCKFFQMNRCPHPPDVCDFAHVIAPPFNEASTDKGSSMCRYYYAGRCANGAMCKYQHGSEGQSTKPFDSQSPAESVADWAAASSSKATYPDSPPLYGTYLPYTQSWPSAVYSLHTPFSPQSPESMLFAPSTRSRDSIQSIDTTSTSNTSSLESDEVMILTDDPKYDEHPHSHQSQVCVADDSPVIHVPPFHHPFLYVNGTQGLGPGFDYAYAPGMGVKMPSPTKSRIGVSKSSLKQKALKYKTKPCKFFPTEKGCPNGNACTFMHDEPRSGTSSPVPAKPLTAGKDDNARKNFVPIPWRVIGGGVPVSIKKDDDNDESFDPDADCPIPSKPGNISLPPLKIISRQRSNSIPSTPSITQVKAEHLFSAESPGVL